MNDPKTVAALLNWMKEVTGLLCYRIDVPQQHKEDLVKALERFVQCAEPPKRK